jgi:hypothetical protein
MEISGFTSLKCLEEIYYKADVDYYRKSKKILLIFSIILSVLCILFVIVSDGWVQSLFSVLFGGVLSLIVWLVSVRLTDEMNYRIARVDNAIAYIDKMQTDLHTFDAYGIEGLQIIYFGKDNILYRMCHLLQIINDLCTGDVIDSSELELKWIDTSDLPINDFAKKLDRIIFEKTFLQYTDEQLTGLVTYNEQYLDGQLSGLKDVLLKRKSYILCGNAPIPAGKVQNRINKANKFDRIFHTKHLHSKKKGN